LNPGEESNFFGDELYVNIVTDFINVKKEDYFWKYLIINE
jgi:hypothetical protein